MNERDNGLVGKICHNFNMNLFLLVAGYKKKKKISMITTFDGDHEFLT